MQWLSTKKIYLDADDLGICKTKMVGYLTNIHPQVIHHTSTKQKISDTLNLNMITPNKAILLDPSLQATIDTAQETADKTMMHCPQFKIFQTTIRVNNGNTRFTTDVLGIKCAAGKITLLWSS